VESEPGKGTTFKVLLPQMKTSMKELLFPEMRLPAGRGERVLVVDDEETLAKVLQLMLESLGYRAEVRTSSPDALQAFAATPDAYDLIIADMTMPHMTGDDLARRILEIRPHMPIILCTGYSELINDDRAREQGIRALIMKPIVRKELAESVRKALQSQEGKD